MRRTLVIQAGGKSSRMGKDKAFLSWQGTTFLQHLIRKAKPYFSRICISCGTEEHTEEIRHLLGEDAGVLFITDVYEQIGPMGGILSIFETIRPELFVLLAVDMPHADMDVLARLYDLAETGGEAAVMLKLPDAGTAESCAAAYTREAYQLFKSAYEKGEFGLFQALQSGKVRFVEAADLQPYLPGASGDYLKTSFCNVNTPDDYLSVTDIRP